MIIRTVVVQVALPVEAQVQRQMANTFWFNELVLLRAVIIQLQELQVHRRLKIKYVFLFECPYMI